MLNHAWMNHVDNKLICHILRASSHRSQLDSALLLKPGVQIFHYHFQHCRITFPLVPNSPQCRLLFNMSQVTKSKCRYQISDHYNGSRYSFIFITFRVYFKFIFISCSMYSGPNRMYPITQVLSIYEDTLYKTRTVYGASFVRGKLITNIVNTGFQLTIANQNYLRTMKDCWKQSEY